MSASASNPPGGFPPAAHGSTSDEDVQGLLTGTAPIDPALDESSPEALQVDDDFPDPLQTVVQANNGTPKSFQSPSNPFQQHNPQPSTSRCTVTPPNSNPAPIYIPSSHHTSRPLPHPTPSLNLNPIPSNPNPNPNPNPIPLPNPNPAPIPNPIPIPVPVPQPIPIRYAPPPGPPPPHLVAPQALAPPAPIMAIQPAPAGIDPNLWQANQALVLSLMPLLQQMATPAAPAPAAPAPPTNRKEGDAKAPTAFSGEDHTKLRDFLFECGLIFDMKPFTFATEKARVLYAIQHLDGMAKRHFRRFIEAGSTDPKVNYWAAFTRELEAIFGEPDRVGKASGKLLGLSMKETGRVHRYTVLFRESADELGWPDEVLHRLYYNGLPNRIKDLWARTDPPADFTDLIREAQRADNRYWKRVEEKKGETTSSNSSNSKGFSKPSTTSSSNSSSSRFTPRSSSSTSTSQNRTTTSTSTPTPRTASTSAKPKDLSKILGSDGKLLPEEKARREKLGLCFYCVEKHPTNQCPKKASKKEGNTSQPAASPKPASNTSGNSKPKGRVAQVVTPVEEESESEEAVDNSSF